MTNITEKERQKIEKQNRPIFALQSSLLLLVALLDNFHKKNNSQTISEKNSLNGKFYTNLSLKYGNLYFINWIFFRIRKPV